MILPEELLEDMKFYYIKRREPKWDEGFSDDTCYDLVVIVTKQWWKRNLKFKFPCKKNGYKDYQASNECIELVNQLKTCIAADNGYKVSEPTVKLGIHK